MLAEDSQLAAGVIRRSLRAIVVADSRQQQESLCYNAAPPKAPHATSISMAHKGQPIVADCQTHGAGDIDVKTHGASSRHTIVAHKQTHFVSPDI